MIHTIGMIGAGNMGSAILRGIVEAEYVRASQSLHSIPTERECANSRRTFRG